MSTQYEQPETPKDVADYVLKGKIEKMAEEIYKDAVARKLGGILDLIIGLDHIFLAQGAIKASKKWHSHIKGDPNDNRT